jgi:hypothetical protein
MQVIQNAGLILSDRLSALILAQVPPMTGKEDRGIGIQKPPDA